MFWIQAEVSSANGQERRIWLATWEERLPRLKMNFSVPDQELKALYGSHTDLTVPAVL
jgi:hypothetical protein